MAIQDIQRVSGIRVRVDRKEDKRSVLVGRNATLAVVRSARYMKDRNNIKYGQVFVMSANTHYVKSYWRC